MTQEAAQEKPPKFTAESGLGFMRFIQFCNVVFIIMLLLTMLFVSGTDMPIDFLLMSIVVSLVDNSVIIWLIAKRKACTRKVAVVFYLIDIVNNIIPYVLAGNLTVGTLVSCALWPVLAIVYFLTSRRAKAVLVQPFDVRGKDKDLEDQTKMWNPRSVDFWLRLLIYFFVFSVMGHWMEMGVQVLVVHGLFPGTVAGPDSLTWRDNLNPFFIYGIAVAFCGLALFPVYVKLKEKCPSLLMAFVISFLINMAFCVVAELLLGFAFNADHQAWDYSNQPFNFEGQICLLYSLAFGVFSSVITWLLYPFMEKHMNRLGKDAFRVLFVASAVVFALLYVTYNVDLARLGILPQQSEDAVTEALRDEGDAAQEQLVEDLAQGAERNDSAAEGA